MTLIRKIVFLEHVYLFYQARENLYQNSINVLINNLQRVLQCLRTVEIHIVR